MWILIQLTGSLIIGGAVGWFVHRFAVQRDDRKRLQQAKDAFLGIIGRIEADLDGCQHIDDRTAEVHRSSLVPLRDAVSPPALS